MPLSQLWFAFGLTYRPQNAFSADIPSSDVSAIANCTTCSFSEDLSNYWTANLYFKARNGTYKRVPQIPNRFLDGETGGMTIYYTSSYDNTNVTAFKPVCLAISLHSLTTSLFLTPGSRASACLQGTPRREPRGALPSGTQSASDATPPRTLAEITWLLAQTARLIASRCRTRCALVVSAQRLGSRRTSWLLSSSPPSHDYRSNR